jgi:hypothetical protein
MNVSRAASVAILTALGVWVVTPTMSGARQESLRAERTVPYKTSEPHRLGVVVGPVKVSSVRFSDLGRAARPFGIPVPGRASEFSTTLRSAFEAENPKPEDWEVTFTVEYLDRAGKIIDRAQRSGEFEGEAKTFQIDHDLLTYVIQYVDHVRIRIEAKLD